MSKERTGPPVGRFDKEFKVMTVELSKSRVDLTELAEELGIRVELIYRWRRELLDKGEGHRGAVAFQAMESQNTLRKKQR